MNQQLTHLEEILGKLIAQPTISADVAANTAALSDIQTKLKSLGMATQLVTHNESPSLITSFGEFNNTNLWLAAHIDVVPGNPQDFVMKIRDDKLFGRGAYDMKYAIACYLQLAKDMSEQKLPFGIILTSDEELGGQNGARFIPKYVGLANSTVVLPDGGGSWKIERQAKGGLWLELSAKGTTGHASRPYMGDNAITKIVSALHDLETNLPHANGTSFNDLTFVVGTIQGGEAANQMAASAKASIDIRFGTAHTLSQVKNLVSTILSVHTDVTSSLVMEAEPHTNDLNHTDTKLFRKITAEVLGKALEEIDSNGGTDAPYFSAAGAHTIVLYPDGGGQHSDEEYISRQGLQQFYEILKTFVVQKLAAERQDAGEL